MTIKDDMNTKVYLEGFGKFGDQKGVGIVRNYINLTEDETAKLLYQRLNVHKTTGKFFNMEQCREFAQEIRERDPLAQYITESPINVIEDKEKGTRTIVDKISKDSIT